MALHLELLAVKTVQSTGPGEFISLYCILLCTEVQNTAILFHLFNEVSHSCSGNYFQRFACPECIMFPNAFWDIIYCIHPLSHPICTLTLSLGSAAAYPITQKVTPSADLQFITRHTCTINSHTGTSEPFLTLLSTYAYMFLDPGRTWKHTLLAVQQQ